MFDWFKSKSQRDAEAIYKKDLELTTSVPRLHGFRLDQWAYLGYSRIMLNYVDVNAKAYANVFFFCLKDNTDKRDFVVVSEETSKFIKEKFDSHQYVTGFASIWRAGEEEIYQCINYRPGTWLKEYMLEHFKCDWDNDKKWWVSNNQAKYNSAAAKQKTTKIDTTSDTNVISVDFTHKPTDNT